MPGKHRFYAVSFTVPVCNRSLFMLTSGTNPTSMTRRKDLLFLLTLLSSLGFASTSWLWHHYANLFISIPFGTLSLTGWIYGRKSDDRPTRYLILPILWLIGICAAFWPW